MGFVEYAIEKKGFTVKCNVCDGECYFMRPLTVSTRHWELVCKTCGHKGGVSHDEVREYIKGSILVPDSAR